MNADSAVTRHRISGMLWDRVPESQANTSFRQALRQLTVALQPLADELIVLSRDTIRLDASACWIDARAVLAPEPPPACGSRGDLAAPCPSEMLEGLDGISVSFDQWLITERTRFNERLRELLEAELRAAAASGAERRAAVARRVIGFDPPTKVHRARSCERWPRWASARRRCMNMSDAGTRSGPCLMLSPLRKPALYMTRCGRSTHPPSP